jgi:single-strand DNA-binding protein
MSEQKERKYHNEIRLRGTLGRDPEFRRTQFGGFVTMSVATTESWKAADGQWKDETQWHRVQSWDQDHVQMAEDWRKGDRVELTGKMVYREWEKDGVKRNQAEIHVKKWHEFFKVEDARPRRQEQTYAGNTRSRPAPASRDFNDGLDDGSEIPF